MINENQPLRLLFVCTHNACRSILAEAIGNSVTDGRLICQSAGSHPAGRVHPDTLNQLKRLGLETVGLRSKGYDDVEAFAPNVVITVCDSAADEPCPAWVLNNALRVHWGLKDPTHSGGDRNLQEALFDAVIDVLKRRLLRISNELGNRQEREALQTVFSDAEAAESPRYPR